MANISPTITIDISHTSNNIENISMGESFSPTKVTKLKLLFQEFHDIFAWSYKERPNFDPTIIEHNIDTWPNATPIRQKRRPMHPTKAHAIKLEIDKLWEAKLIFPIEYTSLVSSLVSITKK